MQPLDYHNNPPNTPSNPHPANGEINVNINPILSWTGGDSDSYDIVTYDVYFGIEPNPPLLQSDHQIPLLQLPELNHSTHYYWKIVARDTSGSTTEGPTWDFTTEREPVTSSLDIELIAGGFGVSASVKNKGDGTATDVDWSITLDGGFILLGEETTGMEESIAAGASAPIKSSLILGFGKTTIVVTATCTESSVTKNATAFVFLFFVLGVK